MFIICNGAFKSGSTWLYLIVKEILQLKGVHFNKTIVEKWQSNSNPNILFGDSTVDEAIGRYAANESDYYLSKVHLLEKESYKKVRQIDKNLKVIFISRNTGDAIVSHYHHVKTEIEYPFSFNSYYWFIGRYKAMEIESFEINRKEFLPNTLHIQYEDLKEDFFLQVKKIAIYLGFEINNNEINHIKENTSLSNLKRKAKKGKIQHYSTDTEKAAKHFRKGEVGEAKRVFTSTQMRDIEKIRDGNTSILFHLIYFLLFKFRRYFYKI